MNPADRVCVRFGTPLNTTSPANQQVEGFGKLTTESLKQGFDLALEPNLPCPTDFLITIVRITSLRGIVARAGGSYETEQKRLPPAEKTSQQVMDMFNAMKVFDIHEWAKNQVAQYPDVTPALVKLFVVAIRLYGILTLPRSAILPWATSEAALYPTIPGLDIHPSVRAWHRKELLAQLRVMWETVTYKCGLAWPLIVVGVAAAEGSAEDRAFIDECLFSIWKQPHTAAGFISSLEKLRVFWESGRTEWEDCFDEPTACYP